MRYAIVLLSVMLVTSCATVFNWSRGPLTITSNPPGADVTLDDDEEVSCQTPCKLPVKPDRHHKITVSKDGYETEEELVRRSIHWTFFLNCALSTYGLIPAGVDWLSGNMWRFKREKWDFQLTSTGEDDEDDVEVEEPPANTAPHAPAGESPYLAKVKEIVTEKHLADIITQYYGKLPAEEFNQVKARLYAILIEQYLDEARLDPDEAVRVDHFRYESKND